MVTFQVFLDMLVAVCEVVGLVFVRVSLNFGNSGVVVETFQCNEVDFVFSVTVPSMRHFRYPLFFSIELPEILLQNHTAKLGIIRANDLFQKVKLLQFYQ